MITERNMIFANPQAYRVFPQIGNTYNTGITDTAIYTGYLQMTDSSGNTKSFSNTSTIDFTGFTGIVDIDQYTDTGSVKLGRWKILETTPEPEPEPEDSWRVELIYDPRFSTIPAEGATITSTDNYYMYMVATNEAQGKTIYIPTKYCRADTLYNSWVTIDGNTTITHEGIEATAVSFTAEANTEQQNRTALLVVHLRLNPEQALEVFGDPNMMGFYGSYNLYFGQEANNTWISPYTPGWSMEFGYISSGTAAKKITNGIEVYSTGPDTNSDTSTFFNYNEAIKEGETYYQATIQVTGMKEGYTIVGVRGWESVTITQDGEYILPAYTWTNEQGLPEGSDIYNDYKPALKFTEDAESNLVWDEPIKIIITSVQTD